jgi:type I restriction enzyme M protein
MVAIGSNFFYTVTLPVTLWFLDKGKRDTDRAGQVLFLDARHVFRQIDRAHRDFTPDQHEFLANIVRLFRNEEPEFLHGSETMLRERFPDLAYVDVPGLCMVATVEEIESNGWSLNPGRYVGVADGEDDGLDFVQRFGELTEEFQALSIEAAELQERIFQNAPLLLEGP